MGTIILPLPASMIRYCTVRLWIVSRLIPNFLIIRFLTGGLSKYIGKNLFFSSTPFSNRVLKMGRPHIDWSIDGITIAIPTPASTKPTHSQLSGNLPKTPRKARNRIIRAIRATIIDNHTPLFYHFKNLVQDINKVFKRGVSPSFLLLPLPFINTKGKGDTGG